LLGGGRMRVPSAILWYLGGVFGGTEALDASWEDLLVRLMSDGCCCRWCGAVGSIIIP
jgi:hypothetical protein